MTEPTELVYIPRDLVEELVDDLNGEITFEQSYQVWRQIMRDGTVPEFFTEACERMGQ